MSDEPLKLIIPEKDKIRSWKDLLAAAEALEKDADNHGYGAFRSSGRKYCANVKVHSYGDLDKALAKLGAIDPEIQETIEEDFDDCSDLFYEWLNSEAEYLQEWFKGVAHSTPEYYDDLIAKVRAGEPTAYPAIEGLETVRERVAEIRKWQAEDKLFREAFKAADDGDSIVWEGKSGGYITWDPCSDVGNIARDVANTAYASVHGEEPDQCFRDALSDFRYAERIHLLNLALINYLEAWAKRMCFQKELDYVVMQRFDELGGAEKSQETLEQYGDLEVTFEDSIAAGNCESGTAQWIERNIPGRTSATVAELLKIDDMQSFVRRLCRFVIRQRAYP